MGIAGIRREDMLTSLFLAGAMILGFGALHLVKSAGNEKSRKVSPVIWVPVLLAGLWILGFLSWAGARPTQGYSSANRVRCINNLKQIGTALRLYEDREGRLPDAQGIAFLGRLLQTGDVADPKVFLCRESRGVGTPSALGFSTDYVPNPVMIAGLKAGTWGHVPNPATIPIVWERKPFHADGTKRCVLFQDGSAAVMNEADFQTLLVKGGKP